MLLRMLEVPNPLDVISLSSAEAEVWETGETGTATLALVLWRKTGWWVLAWGWLKLVMVDNEEGTFVGRVYLCKSRTDHGGCSTFFSSSLSFFGLFQRVSGRPVVRRLAARSEFRSG